MLEKQVSAGWIIAYGLWALALTVWGVSWATGSRELGILSILIMGAGATATVRRFFVAQDERIKAALLVTSVVREVRPIR